MTVILLDSQVANAPANPPLVALLKYSACVFEYGNIVNVTSWDWSGVERFGTVALLASDDIIICLIPAGSLCMHFRPR